DDLVLSQPLEELGGPHHIPVPERVPAVVILTPQGVQALAANHQSVMPVGLGWDMLEDLGGVDETLAPDLAAVPPVIGLDLADDLVLAVLILEPCSHSVPVLDVEQIDFGHARASLSASVTSSPANARSSSDVCLCACR